MEDNKEEIQRKLEQLERLNKSRYRALKNYQQKNKEKLAEYSRDYYNKHKDDEEWKRRHNETSKRYKLRKKEEKKQNK